MTKLTALLNQNGWLDIINEAGTTLDRRQLSDDDFKRFAAWSQSYRQSLGKTKQAAELLSIGHEIHDWLNGDKQVLEQITQTILDPPLVMEFSVEREPNKQEQAFLDAPWELLATGKQHWCLRDTILFCPVRRLGRPLQPPAPAPNRLSAVFMAASPEGLSERERLNFEAEETAILKGAEQIGLDLIVEESGTLPLLKTCLAREKPEVVHISCHGVTKPQPGLLVEDEIGQMSLAMLDDIRKLAAYSPRLLFFSACKTAAADSNVEALARGLAYRGFPAVLGWSGSVSDFEASQFAAFLYKFLAEGQDLAGSMASARLELAALKSLGPEGSRDWHLARLYLGPKGGGVLATANGPRRRLPHHAASKAFLDAKGQKIPVASEAEFVGRRRQIQKILREFRQTPPQHAGVYIHGIGRQGKSSLATRVAHRLSHSHELVVVYGRYDAPIILEAIRQYTGWPRVAELINNHLAAVAKDPSSLFPALVEILSGPCAQEIKDNNGGIQSRPILLVIDDFEQALEPQPEGKHRIKAEYAQSIRALMLAFEKANTDSRLLFTSRVEFALQDGTRDLFDCLSRLDLVPMEKYESRKQAAAKQRFQSLKVLTGLDDETEIALRLKEAQKRMDSVISTAKGNPGLQDLLFSLCLQNPQACDDCLAEMDEYLNSGTLPEKDAVRQFLENLAVDSLIKLLTNGQRELLRASKLFEVPIPLRIIRKMAVTFGLPCNEDDFSRLVALSLWEEYPAPMHPSEQAVAVNALVRPLAGKLQDHEARAIASHVIKDLFQSWGGMEKSKERPALLDHELARLALLAQEAQVLAATAARAMRFLENQFDYRRAAALAKASLDLLGAQKEINPSIRFLRTAAECLHQIGEVTLANEVRQRALAALENAPALDAIQHAATLLDHGRALAQQGKPDEALKALKQAQEIFPDDREKAIVMGEIARILRDKGEVEKALGMHQEQLKIYESLGETRERAITMGDIARILTHKGEVDQALVMHREEVKIYESLGDTRSRAITLSDIARILTGKGEVDKALAMHQEGLEIYEDLGDARSRAGTLGDIARILRIKGEVDKALAMHQEGLKIYEELGDSRSRAVTLGDIARILTGKGEAGKALAMHEEQLRIQQLLGDTRERAITLGDIARILTYKGEVDKALVMHQEELKVYELLGDTRSRAVTLSDIARILIDKGEVDKALAMHQEQLKLYESLGDLDCIANASWDIAQIRLMGEDYEAAFEPLRKSYSILLQIGRLEGIAVVGTTLGQLLYAAGQREEGLKILIRSRDGCMQLGREKEAQEVQDIITGIQNGPAA